ncbi:glutamine--tRNA ligase/YqeY domain fusion protein [Sandaracinus amylolyticus]|uniref:Glutamine--tRNA ligase n=1 Tax=Sandaracinus amylolyticus TaxID=927083 RepID=A0A0F6YGA9_9BACT|nr:glutamine--tRNA ligase/YqeY domain fusion protein [Sandaracinus amylolyticus]AKF04470.1 Glutaminyl-tRNA synthetase [Sandaracinus amylolyticus]
MSSEPTPTTARRAHDFIRDIIDEDLRAGRHTRIATRFPPEPNGYLHIGHAKSICLNFGVAREYGGTCNLRYDDTNPEKEDIEYVRSIEADVRWLGFAPTGVYFSADYFPKMYELAERLVREGNAYVCDLDEEQIRVYRGSLSEPGKPSPYRDRSVEENLDLLRRMKAGEFPDGARTLRAKIDMASPNMKLRDPLLYRIRHAEHHRTGDAWCIYPMYDYAHPLEDAIEGITHSICTLEFENNRAVYDWVLEHTGPWTPRPRQYEFARLALDYTVMSKRKLLTLVERGHVSGWDDPRMPTIAGMRRRGFSPEALRAFAEMIGVAKANSTVDIGKLEYCVRQDLNQSAPRVLGVLHPIEVELVGATPMTSEAPFFPPDVGKPGSRPLALGSRIYVDRDDWRDEPPADYQRLAPGRTVRLRYGLCITADAVVERDAQGNVTKLRAIAHPETVGGGNPADGRKVSGVVHWVDAETSVPAEVRLYDRLFKSAKPEEGGADFLEQLDPASLVVVRGARVEKSLASAEVGSRWQLERVGYFAVDSDTKPGALVLNRIVTLRDSYAEKTKTPERADKKDLEPKENAKAKTRPKTRSPKEYRAEARARDPQLQSAHDAMIAMGLGADAADLLSGDRATADLFVATTKLGAAPDVTAKWMINELPRALGGKELGEVSLDAPRFAAFLAKLAGNALTGSAAKQALADMIATGKSVDDVVRESAAPAWSAEQIAAEADRLIAANADKAAQVKAGKVGLLGFFVGQMVKAAPGADPKEVNRVLRERLGIA